MKKFGDLVLALGFFGILVGGVSFLGYMAQNSQNVNKGIQRVVLGN